MLTSFRASLFSEWFSDIPDEVICLFLDEVENDGWFKIIRSSCPLLSERYHIFKTIRLLLAFTETGSGFRFTDSEGDTQTMFYSLSETGFKQNIRRHSIGSVISSDYYDLKIPEGKEVSDFPFGYIVSQIKDIEDTCKKASRLSYGYGSNNPPNVCGNSRTTRHKTGGKKCLG